MTFCDGMCKDGTVVRTNLKIFGDLSVFLLITILRRHKKTLLFGIRISNATAEETV